MIQTCKLLRCKSVNLTGMLTLSKWWQCQLHCPSLLPTGWAENGTTFRNSYHVPSIYLPCIILLNVLGCFIECRGCTDAVSPNALHGASYHHYEWNSSFALHECNITGVTSYKRLKRQLGTKKKRWGARDTVVSYDEQTV